MSPKDCPTDARTKYSVQPIHSLSNSLMMSKLLVLITGATGHIGFRTLCHLLQANYRVRISLRRLKQAEKIKAAESIKPYLKDIEFVQVPDITLDNAFDEAIKDVEYVVHIASPIFDTQSQVEGVVSFSIGLS